MIMKKTIKRFKEINFTIINVPQFEKLIERLLEKISIVDPIIRCEKPLIWGIYSCHSRPAKSGIIKMIPMLGNKNFLL